MGTLDRHACRPRVRPRLPSRTPPFATRVQPSQLRLWKAVLPDLPRSPRAAGKPRAQHVESSVDRERLLAARGCEGGAPMANSDLADVWARSLDGLGDLQIQPHQRAWLKQTRPLGLVENTALIATPNEFVKEQLETRLRALITQALSQQLGRDIQLAVTVDPTSPAAMPAADLAPEPSALRPPTPLESLGGLGAHGGLGAPGPLGPQGVHGPHGIQVPDSDRDSMHGPQAPPVQDATGRDSVHHDPGAPRPSGPPRPAGDPAPPPRPRPHARPAGPAGPGRHRARLRPSRPGQARQHRARAAARRYPAELQVHLRDVRDRVEQPVRARGGGRGGRGARPGLQPAVYLRGL